MPLRILLDEQLPRVLAAEFPSHDVRTVQSQGWSGIKNGRLLQLARGAGFDAFLTADRGIEFEQNLDSSGIGIIMLVVRSNRLESLVPLVPLVESELESLEPSTLVKVGG